MWNYYSESSGVNLTYDHAWNMFEGSWKSETNIFNKLDNGIIISRGVVLYDFKQKRKCIKALLDRLYTVYEKAKNQTTDYSKQILQAFKKSVNHMRCFFKNEHYVDEREYRFVLRIPEELILGEKETGDIKEIGFFKRGKVQIPYVDYKVKRDGLERIIINPYVKKEYDMVVSPQNNENDMVVSKENNERIDIIKTSIEEMLWMYKYEGVENFSPDTVLEMLTVCILSYGSLRINSRKKDVRKVYQENGNLLRFVEKRRVMLPRSIIRYQKVKASYLFAL